MGPGKNIIVRLKKIVENVPERDKRGNTEGEIEKYYKSIEAAEDAFMVGMNVKPEYNTVHVKARNASWR